MRVAERMRARVAQLRRARGVEDALAQLLPPKRVREVARVCTRPGEIVERIAEQERFSRVALLNEVAQVLGMRVRRGLHLPSEELVATTGLSLSVMRELGVVPQEGKGVSGKALLAVADPRFLDRALLQSYQLELGFASEIDAIWRDLSEFIQELDVELQKERKLIVLLRRMATDAAALGACEAFIGIPSAGSYEIHAPTKVYRGQIAEQMYAQLDSWLLDNESREFRVDRTQESAVVQVRRATGGHTPSFIVRLR